MDKFLSSKCDSRRNQLMSVRYIIFDINYVIFGASVLMEWAFFTAWTYVLGSLELKVPPIWSFHW